MEMFGLRPTVTLHDLTNTRITVEAALQPATRHGRRGILLRHRQNCVTATFRHRDGHTVHLRRTDRAEPPQIAVYNALGIDTESVGTRKTIA